MSNKFITHGLVAALLLVGVTPAHHSSAGCHAGRRAGAGGAGPEGG